MPKEVTITMPDATTIAPSTREQIDAANASGKPPVVFIHGLWLLPSSWDRWAAVFAEAGFAPVKAGWPDDPETVEAGKAHPDVFAGKSVGMVADHMSVVIGLLGTKPAVVGHSFGGLLTMIQAGRGLSAASVAIDSAPFRGILPLPVSALRSSSPVLTNPLNYRKAVPLTFTQWRYAFANTVSEDEAKTLYDTFCVPASGTPIFQAAAANLNPWTQAQADTRNPARGPLLVVSGESDHVSPPAINKAIFKLQRKNPGITELASIAGRSHGLTIDNGWREVCDTSLRFIQRFV